MYLRSVRVITQPEIEPVTLAEAKSQVNLLQEQEDDDALLLRLIATGRNLVEQKLGVALAAKRMRATFVKEDAQSPVAYSGLSSLLGFGGFGGYGGVGAFPYPSAYPSVTDPRNLRLPAPPLLVDSDHPLAIQLDGVDVSPTAYTVDTDSLPGVVRFNDEPMIAPRGSLQIVYWAGPAPGDRISPNRVSAILLIVSHLYRNREATTGDGLKEMPIGLEALLAAESITGSY